MILEAVIVIAAALGFSALGSVVMDPELARLFNTALNIATIAYVLRVQRDIRRNVAPTIGAIEQAITDGVDNFQTRPGGNRRHDPPLP